MRFIFTLLAAILYSSISAQVQSDSLRSSNFHVRITSDGSIENWRVAGSGNPLMYNQQVWLGGMLGSTLHHSSQTQRSVKANFFPGPVSSDHLATSRYNRVWRVTRQQIDSLKQGLYSSLPAIINDWPAHGDTNFGEPYFLAPFVDLDGDRVYEPGNGEYPDIKGVECIYFVCNDAAFPQQNPNYLEIDIQGLLYRFEGGLLDSMFFIDYVISNRSNNTYSDIWLSSYADMDIGNAMDDLMATEVNSSSVFVYNGDAYDEGPDGFGYELASAAMFQRTGPMADIFDGIDNERDGCIDGVRDAMGVCQPENLATGVRETILMSMSNYIYSGGGGAVSDPGSELEERNIMAGICNNGMAKDVYPNHSVWDVGIPSTSCQASTFNRFPAFTGSSYDTTGQALPFTPLDWYESPLDKGDKKAVLSVGYFQFDAGESLNFSLGFVWQRADSANSSVDGGYANMVGTLDSVHAVVGKLDTTSNGLSVQYSPDVTEASSLRIYFDTKQSCWIISSAENHHDLELYEITGILNTRFSLDKNSIKSLQLGAEATRVYILVDKTFGQAYKLMR